MTRPATPSSFLRQPLDAVLAGTASVRVLRALLAHGGLLSVTRLARDAAITPQGTRDVLALLQRTGVVEGVGSGRTWLYRAVPTHPVAAALDALFAAERQRFGDILSAISDAANVPGVIAVWLFGSVARWEDAVGSDVDVAIVVDAPEQEVTAIATSVRDRVREHEDRLAFTASIVPMSLADLARLRSERARLWSDLVRDARVLRGKPPELLADLEDDAEAHG